MAEDRIRIVTVTQKRHPRAGYRFGHTVEPGHWRSRLGAAVPQARNPPLAQDQSPIYLDNAATTPLCAAAAEALDKVGREAFGNASSIHSFGKEPKKLLQDAREFLRGTLHAAQIVLTSGGTEADQLGVLGAAMARPRGRVLCGAADHPAILMQRELLGRLGYELMTVATTQDGDLHPETLFEAMGKDVRVVSILHGHNELGTLANVQELVEVVRRTAPDAHVHVDLVQSYGKVPFDIDELDVDSVAVAGHKLHAPRGIGFLALSSTAQVKPILLGGGQEEGMRGGTENVAGAVALARAAEVAFSHLHASAQHMEALAERMLDQIAAAFPDVERLGNPERHLPHVLSLRIPAIVAHTLLLRCDSQGLAFSTGAACPGDHQSENHVHKAIRLTKQESRETMRFSFSRATTAAEVDRAASIVVAEAHALRDLAPAQSVR